MIRLEHVAAGVMCCATGLAVAQDEGVVLAEFPGEFRLSMSTWTFDYGPQRRVQVGQTVVLTAEQVALRSGSFAALAASVQFNVRNSAGAIVWNGPPVDVGDWYAAEPGPSGGFGQAWFQTNDLSQPVPPGVYSPGMHLTDPAYDAQTEYSAEGMLQIIDGSWLFVHSCQQFGDPSQIGRGVAAGDLNGDGLPELVMQEQQNIVYWNLGDGLFETGYAFGDAAGPKPARIALADLNGDGSLDLVESVYAQFYPEDDELRIYLNSGSGVFGLPSSVPFSRPLQSPSFYVSQSLALGDLEGDGDTDLIVAYAGESAVHLFFNDGAGIFTAGAQQLASPDVLAVALGDVDDDGDLDLYSANRIWDNDGGIFTDSGQILGTALRYGAAFGDIDRDHDLDLVVSVGAGPNEVYLNDGTGVFVLRDSFDVRENDSTQPVVLADLDLDHNLDMVTGGDYVDLYAGNRRGRFAHLADALQGRDAVLIDVDLDGDLDLAAAGLAKRLYLNTTKRAHRGRGRGPDVGGSCPWRMTRHNPAIADPAGFP